METRTRNSKFEISTKYEDFEGAKSQLCFSVAHLLQSLQKFGVKVLHHTRADMHKKVYPR